MEWELAPYPETLPLTADTEGELELGYSPSPLQLVRVTRREMLMAVVGKPASGKSSIAVTLNQQLFNHPDRPTVIVVDPDKDTIEWLLASIPPEREEDLVLLDFGGYFQKVAEMGLFARPPYVSERAFADSVMEIFRLKFNDIWNKADRMSDILWAITVTLIAQPKPSILQGVKLLTDPHFRRRAVARVKHPPTLDFWQEFEDWPKPDRIRLIGPVTSRLRQFYRSETLEKILDSSTTQDFLGYFSGHKIVLASFYSEDMKSEVGTAIDVFISQLYLAFSAMLSKPMSERRPVFLTIDESQVVRTPSLPKLLSRGRRQGLNAILLTQFLHNWDKELASSLYGTVGTWVTFCIGPEDAPVMSRIHGGEFTAQKLQNLERFQAVVKTLQDGKPQPSILIHVKPTFPENLDIAHLLVNNQVDTDAPDEMVVEDDIEWD